MLTLKIIQDTFAKQSAKPSESLSADQKQLIKAGKELKIKSWRQDKVTQLVRLIFNGVKSIKNDCVISISPNPLKFSIDNILADWKAWENEGIMEELALQVYRPSLAIFEGEIDKPEVKSARNHVPTVIGILTGLKPNKKRVSLDMIRAQTEATRDRDFAGFSYFFYGSLFDLGFAGDGSASREVAFNDLLSTDKFV